VTPNPSSPFYCYDEKFTLFCPNEKTFPFSSKTKENEPPHENWMMFEEVNFGIIVGIFLYI
jgi:hypothetical protein